MPYYSTSEYVRDRWQLRPYEHVPLPVAVELAEIVTDACQWFHNPRHVFLGDPSAPSMPDDVINEACAALQCQLDKEGRARTKGSECGRHHVKRDYWYQLAELPMARKRALVERIWALRERHGIDVPVYDESSAEPISAAMAYEAPQGFDYFRYARPPHGAVPASMLCDLFAAVQRGEAPDFWRESVVRWHTDGTGQSLVLYGPDGGRARIDCTILPPVGVTHA